MKWLQQAPVPLVIDRRVSGFIIKHQGLSSNNIFSFCAKLLMTFYSLIKVSVATQLVTGIICSSFNHRQFRRRLLNFNFLNVVSNYFLTSVLVANWQYMKERHVSLFFFFNCIVVSDSILMKRSSSQWDFLLKKEYIKKKELIMFCSLFSWIWQGQAAKEQNIEGIRTLHALSVLLTLTAWRPEIKIITSDTSDML